MLKKLIYPPATQHRKKKQNISNFGQWGVRKSDLTWRQDKIDDASQRQIQENYRIGPHCKQHQIPKSHYPLNLIFPNIEEIRVAREQRKEKKRKVLECLAAQSITRHVKFAFCLYNLSTVPTSYNKN